MKGFKDSTKTQYSSGGSCYAKGGAVADKKIGRVMTEFTEGKLHSGSKEGPKVKSTKQAVAIALNEARAAGAKIPRVKKGHGGEATLADMNRANRDVGGLDKAGEAAMRATVARGNRMQAEEAGESALVRRSPKPRSVTVERATVSEAPATRRGAAGMGAMSDAERMISKRRGPAGQSYNNMPLIDRAVNAVRRVTGLKKGGLAVMPKGKGKC